MDSDEIKHGPMWDSEADRSISSECGSVESVDVRQLPDDWPGLQVPEYDECQAWTDISCRARSHAASQPASTCTHLSQDIDISMSTEPAHVEEGLRSFDFTQHSMPYFIDVTQPLKHGETLKDAYVTYLVETTDKSTKTLYSVRRRFSEFAALHSRLVVEHPECIVCPLPQKHRLEYITGDRFSSKFIEKRRLALRRFLVRLVRHPCIQKNVHLEGFLKQSGYKITSPSVEVDLTRFSGVFSKIKNPDSRFVNIRGDIKRLEANLMQLEAVYMKTSKKAKELEQNVVDFGAGLTSLGVLEPQITDLLTSVGAGLLEYTQALGDRNRHEEIELASNLRDYLAYCGVVRQALRQREEKQLHCETLAEALAAAKSEQERVSSGEAALQSKSQALGSYIIGVYEEMRGVDQEKARLERIDKLQTRINKLEADLLESQHISAVYSAAIAKEIDYFHAARSVDLKEIFSDYAEQQIIYYKKSVRVWDRIISDLERYK